MKKTGIFSLLYSILFVWGHNGYSDANAQNLDVNLQPYAYSKDDMNSKGKKYADCALDTSNKAMAQKMRNTINGY